MYIPDLAQVVSGKLLSSPSLLDRSGEWTESSDRGQSRRTLILEALSGLLGEGVGPEEARVRITLVHSSEDNTVM